MNDLTNSPDAGGLATMRYLNASAVKAHALKCSAVLRAGRFERVGADFLDDIQAETEALVRKFNSMYLPPIHPVVPAENDGGEPLAFVTRRMLGRVEEALDRCIGRMIQSKVQRHPTVGVTLKS